jgi:hypothetical protein
MDVELTVDLIKQKRIGWPCLENNEYVMVLASARPLLGAFQHATTEMQRMLVSDYGFNEKGRSCVHGTGGRVRNRKCRGPQFHSGIQNSKIVPAALITK